MNKKLKLIFWPDTRTGLRLLISHTGLMSIYYGSKTFQSISNEGYVSVQHVAGLLIDIISLFPVIVFVRFLLITFNVIKPVK